MKIYTARTNYDSELDKYIGKDIWLQARGRNMKVFYIRLLEKLPEERYRMNIIPWVSILGKDPVVKVHMHVPEAYKICWELDHWRNYALMIDQPLNVLTTPEILEMAGLT